MSRAFLTQKSRTSKRNGSLAGTCPLDICKDNNDFDNGKEFCQKRKIFFLSCFFTIFDVLSFHIKKKGPDGNNN